jgi:hypothetical protein
MTGIDPSLNDNINRWENSVNGGVTWSTITGTTNKTTTTYILRDVQVTCKSCNRCGDCDFHRLQLLQLYHQMYRLTLLMVQHLITFA